LFFRGSWKRIQHDTGQPFDIQDVDFNYDEASLLYGLVSPVPIKKRTPNALPEVAVDS